MASNKIPSAFPSVFVLSTEAFLGADQHGAESQLSAPVNVTAVASAAA